MVEKKTLAVKKLLLDGGFLIYETRSTSVWLAERVRDNLIMEAGVGVSIDPTLRVLMAVRAQRSDFPGASETEAQLFDRARSAAAPARAALFNEVGTRITPQLDPMDPAKVLDTWYEVAYEREAASDDELLEVVRAAISFEKVAPR